MLKLAHHFSCYSWLLGAFAKLRIMETIFEPIRLSALNNEWQFQILCCFQKMNFSRENQVPKRWNPLQNILPINYLSEPYNVLQEHNYRKSWIVTEHYFIEAMHPFGCTVLITFFNIILWISACQGLLLIYKRSFLWKCIVFHPSVWISWEQLVSLFSYRNSICLFYWNEECYSFMEVAVYFLYRFDIYRYFKTAKLHTASKYTRLMDNEPLLIFSKKKSYYDWCYCVSPDHDIQLAWV